MTEKIRAVRTVDKLMQYLTEHNCPIGKSTLLNLIHSGEIPHVKLTSHIWIFHLDAIDQWLQGEWKKEGCETK
ncbi:helix-turn-helix domain-containing protein [Lysinibacillus fusiformis]|uniref:helix-turn-helix domain-containing protein n=1 Tax=Lysinibacillus TaxID=400634 RepID=UPI00232BC049|nr:helix-turn-helix domain-containing protein [Lysinibacillus sp. OF-1]MEE3805692.1 helix-turn-helix domain-containing protein [Lysinibacillus fusiformis]WCH46602.1 helix-turn-helix domain-containing protein [Lysinibacillus sp. OF-1]